MQSSISELIPVPVVDPPLRQTEERYWGPKQPQAFNGPPVVM